MSNGGLLGLDVGSVRVGVAFARLDVRIAQPLVTLRQGPSIFEEIHSLARDHDAIGLVVGWPRDMQGNSTAQTESTEAFANQLRNQTGLAVYLQDEALTSHKAEAELQQRKKPYEKSEVDALAATYILEDYLRGQEQRAGAGNV